MCPNRDVSVNSISQSVCFQSINLCLTAVVSGGSENFARGGQLISSFFIYRKCTQRFTGLLHGKGGFWKKIEPIRGAPSPPTFESASGLYFINADTSSTEVRTIDDSFETIPAQQIMLRRHCRTL